MALNRVSFDSAFFVQCRLRLCTAVSCYLDAIAIL